MKYRYYEEDGRWFLQKRTFFIWVDVTFQDMCYALDDRIGVYACMGSEQYRHAFKSERLLREWLGEKEKHDEAKRQKKETDNRQDAYLKILKSHRKYVSYGN